MLRDPLNTMMGWPSTIAAAVFTGIVVMFAVLGVGMIVAPDTNYEAGLPLLLAAFCVGFIVGGVLSRRRSRRRNAS